MVCIQEQLADAEIRPFPVIATKILKLANDPNSRPSEMTELITLEPAIAVRILRVANSPAYGFSRQISSIEQAVVVLGGSAIRDLVISAAAADLFQQGDTDNTRARLWNHSLGCAAVASLLASKTRLVPTNEAFLAGVLHDVGKLVLYDHVPDEYKVIDESNSCDSIVAAETEAFGITHEQIGRRCIESWGLPDELRDAASFHHNPGDAETSPQLAMVIACANTLAREWQLGGTFCAHDALDLTTFDVGMDPDALLELREEAEAQYEQLQQACAG